MSAPAPTFVIRPAAGSPPATWQELRALAEALGLLGDDRVVVTIAGEELRIALTPAGCRALERAVA